MLQQLRTYDPPPTAICWFGGGYQGLWRLSEIFVVNGDETLMAPVERRMLCIEKAFGAVASAVPPIADENVAAPRMPEVCQERK